jgi:Mrp family chromosome partitioning ATPase
MIATASDAMQELFDQVLNVCQEDETRPSNRLAVTGAGRGEGTSTIAISIARWAAACGKSVLLIDADLASPSLTTQVGLQHGLSWLKAVERNDDPSEVIIRSQRTELCVMPLAPIEARSNYPRCLFDSLGPFLGKVESHFDWVVIDFGPGSQLLAELSRPELLIDSALLIGADTEVNGLDSLQRRLQNLGLERFVLAQNSVRQQEAA